MYLLPRLFGIATYVILVLLISGLLSRIVNKESNKILFFCDCILCVMAYNYCLTNSDDLYRLLPIMHMFANKTFSQLLESLTSSNYPVLSIYYWIIGQFHNDRLLPAVTSIISYSFFFAIINKSINKFDSESTNISVAFYLFMTRGFFVIGITNVRTIIVISVFSYMVYRELLENKSLVLHIPFYALICLFHNMGMLLTVIRLIFMLFDIQFMKKNKLRYVMTIFTTLLLALRYGYMYIENFRNKSTGYIDAALEGTAYDYIYERIITIICIIIAIFILRETTLIVKSSESLQTDEIKSLFNYNSFIVVIDIVLFFLEYTSFYRMSWLIIILICPLYLFCCKHMSDDKNQIFNNRIVFLSSMMFLLECSRGYLCSLKYFLNFSDL